jgi:hypothetical protein
VANAPATASQEQPNAVAAITHPETANLINSSLVIGTVVVPFISSKLADIAPPGHENPALLSLIQLLIILGFFHCFEGTKARLLRRTSIAALSLCLCSLVLYLGLVESFTYRLPSSSNRIIRGIEMDPYALLVLQNHGCPNSLALSLLSSFHGQLGISLILQPSAQ